MPADSLSIPELPGLQIDDFRIREGSPHPQLFVLTHMHSDHLRGLERRSYKGPFVYCTKATRAIVLNLRAKRGSGELQYHHLRREGGGIEIFRPLDLDVPHTLDCGDTKVQLTLIDANHCPGAAMALVQTPQTAVLYTGDVRCEAWHVNALAKHPQLMPFIARRPLTMYVDMTYESHHDPWRSYKENTAGLDELKLMLKRYPKHCNFNLMDRGTTGYEEVLITLASHFKTKLHIDPYLYHLYLAASSFSSVARTLVDLCTQDPTAARIHWCSRQRRDDICPIRQQDTTIHFQPIVQLVSQYLQRENAEHIYPPPGLKDDQAIFDATSGLYYVWTGGKLLPKRLRFYFSRHASFPELASLIKLFPRVESVKSLDGRRLEALEAEVNSVHGFSSATSGGNTIEDKRELTWHPESIAQGQVSHLKIHARKNHVAAPVSSKSMRHLASKGVHNRKKKRRVSNQSSDSFDDDARKDALEFLNKEARLERQLSTEASAEAMKENTRGKSDDESVHTVGSQERNTAPDSLAVSQLFPHMQSRVESTSAHSPKSATSSLSVTRKSQEEEADSLPSPPPERGCDLDACSKVVGEINESIECIDAAELSMKIVEVKCAKPDFDFRHDTELEHRIRQDPTVWGRLQFDWKN